MNCKVNANDFSEQPENRPAKTPVAIAILIAFLGSALLLVAYRQGDLVHAGTTAAPASTPAATPSNEVNGYTHLYEVMDKYATGEVLRLLESYEDADTFSDGDTAWVYDNALVMLALMARGTDEDWARARTLADAFVYAQNHDPDFSDGRLRDAYHASAFVGGDGKVQVASPGSGVGNVAFATLALLRYWEVERGNFLSEGRDAPGPVGLRPHLRHPRTRWVHRWLRR